jgi:protein gp37
MELMADNTGIEWTDATWNPVTGCTEVSPGCDRCYAKTFAERWRGTPGHYFENGFDVQLRPDKLDLPLRWRQPRRIFVNSMSDLFHDQVPDEYIAQVWGVMAWSPLHTFQILTKRHSRMRSLLSSRDFKSKVDDAWYDFGRRYAMPEKRAEPPTHPYDRWPLPNVWLGVSTENQQWANIRIPALLDTLAAVRFISAEPLLGPISIFASSKTDHDPGLDWVIVGGESGHGARPMHPGWVRSLRNECTFNGVPFLFKQWGEWTPSAEHGGARRLVYIDGESAEVGNSYASGAVLRPGSQLMYRGGKHRAGRQLDGRTWDQYPAAVTHA